MATDRISGKQRVGAWTYPPAKGKSEACWITVVPVDSVESNPTKVWMSDACIKTPRETITKQSDGSFAQHREMRYYVLKRRT